MEKFQRTLKRRELFDRIAERFGVKQQLDWYQISGKRIRSFFGDKILEHYNGSLYSALKDVYKEFEWNPLMFCNVPTNFWNTKSNQRILFDWIAERLEIQTQQDWYSITVRQVKELGASGVINTYYNTSLFSALKAVYPEFEWNEEKCVHIPRSAEVKNITPRVWKEEKNHRKMFDWLSDRLGITMQQDWYEVSGVQVQSLGAVTLLRKYGGSLFNALSNIYSEYDWDPLEFRNTPVHFRPQQKRQFHRYILDQIADELGIETQHDWYSVTGEQVKEFKAASDILYRYYNNSLFCALQLSYSEFEWNPLLCSNPPRNYLEKLDGSLLRKSVEAATTHILGDNEYGDWLHSSSTKVFTRVAKKLGGRKNTLMKLYPEINWSFKFVGSSGEAYLEKLLSTLSTTVEREKMIAGQIVDFYLPKYSIAFEFQGGQHYHPIHTGSYERRRDRDVQKREVLKQYGITLIEVPYWWRGNYSTLLATIQTNIAQKNFSQISLPLIG